MQKKNKLKFKNLIDIVWCGKRALLFIYSTILSSTFTKQLTKVLKDKMEKWMWILDNRLFIYISAIYYLLAEKLYIGQVLHTVLYINFRSFILITRWKMNFNQIENRIIYELKWFIWFMNKILLNSFIINVNHTFMMDLLVW